MAKQSTASRFPKQNLLTNYFQFILRNAKEPIHIYTINFGSYDELQGFEMTKALKPLEKKLRDCFGQYMNDGNSLFSKTKIEDPLVFDTKLNNEEL